MSNNVIHATDIEPVHTAWGSLQWLVSGQAGSSQYMTVGRVTIKPGMCNPRHRHPNCEEVLVVVAGAIEHTLPEGGAAVLAPGDCIVVEQGIVHQAYNIGTEDAVLHVSFNAANRITEDI